MAGSLSLLWWLATGLHLQEGALDVPLEPLTFVLVHLPLLPFQSLSTWRGDDPCTVISFVITDTLYLVLLASRSEVTW